jgi:hypothetical protein
VERYRPIGKLIAPVIAGHHAGLANWLPSEGERTPVSTRLANPVGLNEPKLSLDQPGALQGEYHLMPGELTDAKVALRVGLGRRAAADVRVGIDKSQIRTLPNGEADFRRRRPSHIWVIGFQVISLSAAML